MASGSGGPSDGIIQKEAILAKYNARVLELEQQARSKPDMIAFKELKEKIAPERRHGHLPGINPGEKFDNKGQLAILSLHSAIPRGIDAPSGKDIQGAYAIVLSGGYADDHDEGETFWYTGEGGQDKGRQVTDQSFDKGGNYALKRNFETKTPVRVMRGFVQGEGKGKRRGYVYEGLYDVVEAKMEKSKEGPKVCKFLMKGRPGNSTATTRVEHNIFKSATGTRLKARVLAGRDSDERGATGKRQRTAPADTRTKALQRKLMLKEISRLPNVVCVDISNGQETVPIPLINDVNDIKEVADFTYITDYEWHSEPLKRKVAPVLRHINKLMRDFTHADEFRGCAIAFNNHIRNIDKELKRQGRLPASYDVHEKEAYNFSGCLKSTDCCGVHECPDTCKKEACRRNRQVTEGPTLPLEVFMTPNKGWGVRCRTRIGAGQFIIAYVGPLVSEAMAELRRNGNDHYLYNLDHFALVYMEKASSEDPDCPDHKFPPLITSAKCQELVAAEAAAAEAAVVAEAAAAAAITAAAEAAAEAAAQTAEAATTGAAGADATNGTADLVAGPAAADGGPVDGIARIHYDDDEDSGREGKPGARAAKRASGGAAAGSPGGRVGGSGGGSSGSGSGSGDVEGVPALGGLSPSPPERSRSGEGSRDGPITAGNTAGNTTTISTLPPGAAATTTAGGSLADAPTPATASAAATANDYHEPDELFSGCSSGEYSELLVIDAMRRGNVARFINHSCEGNLTPQAVFAKDCRNTMLYYVGLFANQDIEAGTELTYDYKYLAASDQQAVAEANGGMGSGVGAGAPMTCNCGAPSCRGILRL